MLERFLPAIKDPAEYIAALSLFKLDTPLTGTEAKKLLDIYTKYLPDMEDPLYAKVCLAADMLPGRSEADRDDFSPLELGDGNLDALFTAKKMAEGGWEPTAERTAAVVKQTKDTSLALPVRVLLARIALDLVTASRDFALMREQIAELAAFLTSCGEETLDQYTTLVGEVKMKCKR